LKPGVYLNTSTRLCYLCWRSRIQRFLLRPSSVTPLHPFHYCGCRTPLYLLPQLVLPSAQHTRHRGRRAAGQLSPVPYTTTPFCMAATTCPCYFNSTIGCCAVPPLVPLFAPYLPFMCFSCLVHAYIMPPAVLWWTSHLLLHHAHTPTSCLCTAWHLPRPACFGHDRSRLA